ncbi:hypothetical protein [Novosphingobium guangzhouense]|uniref:Uncharacterized protein n=1 Tax=Novosphingobium guangzhouense TaxID=1850347 RepID=A0A2K2FSN2_9SPHN|nr:hypothetical protein [Novosphingobium guangzhouense]PNU01778.1 hypothetical protein A8V01_12015 [Novosphingobium guangzhouense]
MNVARNHIAPKTGDAPDRTQSRAPGLAVDGAIGGLSAEHLPADPAGIDWQALRSRLFATHDRLGVLGDDAVATRLRLRGSFDGCAASALNAYEECSRNVNLDASSNGKPSGCKDSPVADVNGSGERG